MDIIGAALKALGVKITPEVAKQIEAILPQLPAKINETIGFILAWQKNFDMRLQLIEAAQKSIAESQTAIMEVLLNGKRNDEPGTLGGNVPGSDADSGGGSHLN